MDGWTSERDKGKEGGKGQEMEEEGVEREREHEMAK